MTERKTVKFPSLSVVCLVVKQAECLVVKKQRNKAPFKVEAHYTTNISLSSFHSRFSVLSVLILKLIKVLPINILQPIIW